MKKHKSSFRMALNPGVDTDPSQRSFAPLLRAGHAERWATQEETS